ncbi:SDR family NAD(P)-dependent oxidoreductase, partial [Acinetobacter baumannii]
MTRFHRKTVIVTGGAGGIGSAACRRFAQEGAQVAVFDRALEAAAAVAAGIAAEGGTARAYRCDITTRTEVEA